MAIFEEPNYTTRQFWERLTADDGDPDVYFRNCTIGDENTSEGVAEFGDENGNCHIYKEVICERCTFIGRISFDPITFKKRVSFNHVTFKGNASFRGTVFEGDATFSGDAESGYTVFEDEVGFEEAKFHSNATFSSVKFQVTNFSKTEFKGQGSVTIEACKFNREAIFIEAKF